MPFLNAIDDHYGRVINFFCDKKSITHQHNNIVSNLIFQSKIINQFQVPVSEQELKGKSKKKELEKSSKSGDEKDGEKSQASACEGKVLCNLCFISIIRIFYKNICLYR